jgi:hypothetical protein
LPIIPTLHAEPIIHQINRLKTAGKFSFRTRSSGWSLCNIYSGSNFPSLKDFRTLGHVPQLAGLQPDYGDFVSINGIELNFISGFMSMDHHDSPHISPSQPPFREIDIQ